MSVVKLDDTGHMTDATGKKWRLVPVQTTPEQMKAALDQAKRWGKKGSPAKALAFDYMQGYMELVEHAPTLKSNEVPS